ncbi:putative LRR receptor-like serine/threonine-protein kinase At1g51880 [Bidens hawaiensis]|uniref:putative LRR receptor-like serine/threonine-protein kinase At1g51880 n=1 Tax=Bidens hawaiensis TaxID=980011 RepID=UPI00404950C2
MNTDLNLKDELLTPRKQQFTYSEVRSITNNFKTVIGKGGFGTVYHGYNGKDQVAVKMLTESSVQGYKEFQAEVKLLMDVRHKNITSLVGYCNDNSRKGIIYEYMANGSLEKHLFDGNPRVLSWETRLQIACDAAEGLVYLHHGCRPPIVHRDVKPSNILLNDVFQAKLADFGMSRAFKTEDATHESTVVVGTRGYLDPEYYITNLLSEKSDVYSFGVALLEFITGRRATSENTNLIDQVKSMVARGNVNYLIDPRLEGRFNTNSAWKVVELAIACVSHTSIERPTMNNVAAELKNCLQAEKAGNDRPNDQSGHVSFNVEAVSGPNAR